jgi:hypothetical protein
LLRALRIGSPVPVARRVFQQRCDSTHIRNQTIVIPAQAGIQGFSVG